jgi:hypothetical protein
MVLVAQAWASILVAAHFDRFLDEWHFQFQYSWLPKGVFSLNSNSEFQPD